MSAQENAQVVKYLGRGQVGCPVISFGLNDGLITSTLRYFFLYFFVRTFDLLIDVEMSEFHEI